MKMGISGKSMKAINQFIDGVNRKWIFVRDCDMIFARDYENAEQSRPK